MKQHCKNLTKWFGMDIRLETIDGEKQRQGELQGDDTWSPGRDKVLSLFLFCPWPSLPSSTRCWSRRHRPTWRQRRQAQTRRCMRCCRRCGWCAPSSAAEEPHRDAVFSVLSWHAHDRRQLALRPVGFASRTVVCEGEAQGRFSLSHFEGARMLPTRKVGFHLG